MASKRRQEDKQRGGGGRGKGRGAAAAATRGGSKKRRRRQEAGGGGRRGRGGGGGGGWDVWKYSYSKAGQGSIFDGTKLHDTKLSLVPVPSQLCTDRPRAAVPSPKYQRPTDPPNQGTP
eukprot:scaffold888_cov246-Pinguiococcus_pyrenoidosus.AAC.7